MTYAVTYNLYFKLGCLGMLVSGGGLVWEFLHGSHIAVNDFASLCIKPESLPPFECEALQIFLSNLILLQLAGPKRRTNQQASGFKAAAIVSLNISTLVMFLGSTFLAVRNAVKLTLSSKSPSCTVAYISTSGLLNKCGQVFGLMELMSYTQKFDTFHIHANQHAVTDATWQSVWQWNTTPDDFFQTLPGQHPIQKMMSNSVHWALRWFYMSAFLSSCFIWCIMPGFILGLLLYPWVFGIGLCVTIAVTFMLATLAMRILRAGEFQTGIDEIILLPRIQNPEIQALVMKKLAIGWGYPAAWLGKASEYYGYEYENRACTGMIFTAQSIYYFWSLSTPLLYQIMALTTLRFLSGFAEGHRNISMYMEALQTTLTERHWYSYFSYLAAALSNAISSVPAIFSFGNSTV